MKLINGHALTELRKLEPKSIDMMITSPPYYGLRNYETNPVIWDGDENCEHIWDECGGGLIHENRNNLIGSQEDVVGKSGTAHIFKYDRSGSNICLKCNAWKGELGAEPKVELYIKHLIDIFDEVYRVLKDTGTCWINIADCHAGHGIYIGKYKETHPDHKDLHIKDAHRYPQKRKGYTDKNISSKSQFGIPERLVIGMIDRGWIKRNTIVWHKPSCMPSSAKDRFTIDFEYLYFFTKKEKYFFEQQLDPIANSTIERNKYHVADEAYGNKYPGSGLHENLCRLVLSKEHPETRNKRAVWKISPAHCKELHFAVFPEKLIITPILAGCPEGGIVLDPFMGTGTVGKVALKLGRDFVGIELSPEYFEMSSKKLEARQSDLFEYKEV